MTTFARARASSSASPAAVFGRWADVATWPEWNADTEWVRLDGPFATGTTGTLKPRGGPRVPFVIERLEPGRAFVDVSRLVGARLTFAHEVSETAGGCDVAVEVAIAGPLAPLWRRVVGRGIAATLQADLERLLAAAERVGAPAAAAVPA